MNAHGPVQLRPARTDDAGPLSVCHRACWSEAYTGLVQDPVLAAALAAFGERAERWRQILAGTHGTVLAVAGQEVVGFASAGPQRDPGLDLPVELYALYVRRALWGTGLGERLLAAAVGDAPSSLWVLRENQRARRFYARHGYGPDGAEKLEPVLAAQEIRMVRPAPGAQPGAVTA